MGDASVSQTNIATIQSFYAAFGRGDVAAIVNNRAHDVAWHSGGDPKH